VFGIDDAILIPALVSVVTAAINANSKGQQKNILPDDAAMTTFYRDYIDFINARK